MTQPPLPPQMPPEPQDALPLNELPLNEQERALARALRNLPVGAPPPELDARILGAARRAVHLAPPRKRDNRHWLIGFGTAASALLAIGMILKMHGPGQSAIYTPSAETTTNAVSAAANVPAADAAAAASAAMQDKASTSAAADARAPVGNTAPAEQQAGYAREQAQQPMVTSEEAKQAPSAFPAQTVSKAIPPPAPARARYTAAPSSPVMVDEPASVSAPSPPPAPPAPSVQSIDERAERKAEGYGATRRDVEADAVAAPASPAASAAALDQTALSKEKPNAAGTLKSNQSASDSLNAAEASKDVKLDRIEVTGSRVKHDADHGIAAGGQAARQLATLPAVDDDAKLTSTQWIERIRARVRASDGNAARESLRRYRVRYPDAVIPDDLQPLLK